ncbi:MAG TPA: poly(hydroxyalkanoate) granule-associated protein [Anaerolineae bacterium]|nr:poly(hydroxyalkanoate) granule-associated protein [Anaerolineae bacterium]
MAKQKVEVVVEEPMEEEGGNPIFALARKVLLAGVGAVVLTQEEIEKVINRMVERGEIAEQDGRKLLREVMDKRKKEAKKAEDEMDRRIEEILARLNVPTKSDIDALSAKITALTKKVDELKKS